ncbi:MAG: hypothetical protein WDZ84_04995 [Rhodovibrionaceae bacterium]
MKETDGLSELSNALAIKRSGFHRVEGPGGVAVFPMQATDDAAWEQRALAQTKEAEEMEAATRPAPRPLPEGLMRTIRGD